jgi:hypothetical protein
MIQPPGDGSDDHFTVAVQAELSKHSTQPVANTQLVHIKHAPSGTSNEITDSLEQFNDQGHVLISLYSL